MKQAVKEVLAKPKAAQTPLAGLVVRPQALTAEDYAFGNQSVLSSRISETTLKRLRELSITTQEELLGSRHYSLRLHPQTEPVRPHGKGLTLWNNSAYPTEQPSEFRSTSRRQPLQNYVHDRVPQNLDRTVRSRREHPGEIRVG